MPDDASRCILTELDETTILTDVTTIRCRFCGIELPGPEMPSDVLAHFIRHTSETGSPDELAQLGTEIAAAYLDDDATSTLLGLIQAKAARIVASN